MSEIEVKHLTKTFEQKGLHVEALKDINLTIEAGDIYGIIGMSGAGKSTLVRCLNYLERPTSGEVIIGGRDLGTLTEKELREQIREETRRELETELRESIRAELEEEQAQAETSDEKMPYLIRKKTGEIISLNKQTFIIGKLDTCCDYVIRGNRAISRLHAVIKYKEDTDVYFIVDCNSTNHIYLNGRQIEAEQPETLEDGMHIHLALEEFVFQLK